MFMDKGNMLSFVLIYNSNLEIAAVSIIYSIMAKLPLNGVRTIAIKTCAFWVVVYISS